MIRFANSEGDAHRLAQEESREGECDVFIWSYVDKASLQQFIITDKQEADRVPHQAAKQYKYWQGIPQKIS